MNRPHLDDLTGSLPLHWAKGMEDEPIIPIIYATYLEIWARTLTVAGLRDENQRPYSLRVGAGGRISGKVFRSLSLGGRLIACPVCLATNRTV